MSNFKIGDTVRIKNANDEVDKGSGVVDGMKGEVVGYSQFGRCGWFVKIPGVTAILGARQDLDGNLVFWDYQLELVSGKSVQERITEHLHVVGDLRLAAKVANDCLTSAKAALRKAEDVAEQAYKSQCDGENELRILLDEAAGIEWQQRGH